jgi:hypothetical protein
LGFQFFPPLFFSNGRLHSPFLVCLTTSIIGSFLKGLLCIIAKQTERFSNVDFAFDFASLQLRKYQFPPLTTTNSIIIIQSAAALFLLPMCILFHVPHLYCEHTRNEHKLFTFLSFVYFCQNFPFFSFSTTWREKTCNKNKHEKSSANLLTRLTYLAPPKFSYFSLFPSSPLSLLPFLIIFSLHISSVIC